MCAGEGNIEDSALERLAAPEWHLGRPKDTLQHALLNRDPGGPPCLEPFSCACRCCTPIHESICVRHSRVSLLVPHRHQDTRPSRAFHDCPHVVMHRPGWLLRMLCVYSASIFDRRSDVYTHLASCGRSQKRIQDTRFRRLFSCYSLDQAQ